MDIITHKLSPSKAYFLIGKKKPNNSSINLYLYQYKFIATGYAQTLAFFEITSHSKLLENLTTSLSLLENTACIQYIPQSQHRYFSLF